MLKPADHGNQGVVRYLEPDQPPSEKYRFLLFEDQRAIELIWYRKTNEACSAALPFQTIEARGWAARGRVGGCRSPSVAMFDQRGRHLKGWTNNGWQNFRIKKDCSLELKRVANEVTRGATGSLSKSRTSSATTP